MKLNIYMKSGNVIKLSGIKDWTLRYSDDQITYLYIERSWFALGPKLVVTSINLKQIEAITQQ